MKKHYGLLFLALAISAFAGQMNLKDGSSITGDFYYDGEVFRMENEEIDRDMVKKVFLGDVKGTETSVAEEHKLTESKIAKWREIAEEMEANYPDANGLILYDYGRQTLTADGREINESRYTVKIMTQEAKGWAQRGWYIDEGINRVKILYARSIAPDGTISNYSPEDITYSEPTRGEVFFGKGQSMSLTIPGADIGSIVDIGYIQETYAPEDPELFMGQFFFQSLEPVKYSEANFEVPKGREFHYERFLMTEDDPYIGENIAELPKFSGSVEPTIIETDSSTIYHWELTDIEPLIMESNSIGYMNAAPGIYGGLYPDYSYYHKRFGELHSEHMKLTPELDSLAKAIVGDAQAEEEKVARLYHWVQRNIRYISVKGALASRFGGHYAQITYDNKYGDCSDKAVFFATLCKAVGIEAYPIIVMTNDAGFLDRSRFPFWGGNHAINEVWVNSEPIVLDATANLFRYPYYSMGDCDLYYANYVRGEIVYNPPIAPEDNAMQSKTHVEILPDGSASISDSFWYSGTMEAMYRGWFQYTPEIQHGKVMEQFVAQRKSGATLQDYGIYEIDDISKPFGMKFDYTVDQYLTEAGDYYLLEVPALRYVFDEIELKERNFGIKVDMTYLRDHDVTFTLPEGWTAEFLPEEFHLENEYFAYDAKYEREGNGVRFTDNFRRTKLRIPISEYDSYKEDAEKILAYLKQRIFLAPAS